MANLFSEDLLLADILYNRANNPRFSSGGTTMNSQAAVAGGLNSSIASLTNGWNLYYQGLGSPIGSPLCEDLMDAFQAVEQVADFGSTNTKVYYNWGLSAGGQPTKKWELGKVLITQVNQTLFYGMPGGAK
jgi:hypothetical protein